MTTLIKYDSARFALQQAVEIDEVKDIRDKAQAMAAYARQANDTQLVEWATEIKVRAERKAGQMLSDMPKNPGQLKNSSRSHDATTTKTLTELGINKTQSSRWQKLAAVSDDQFEEAIVAAKEVAGEVTTAAMLRIEKANRPPEQTKPVRQESSNIKDRSPDPKDVEDFDEKEFESLQLNESIKALNEENDELKEENQNLRDAIAANQLPDDIEIQSAEETIKELRKQVRNLEAELSAIKSTRDGLYVQVSELESQCKWYLSKLKKAGLMK